MKKNKEGYECDVTHIFQRTCKEYGTRGYNFKKFINELTDARDVCMIKGMKSPINIHTFKGLFRNKILLTGKK
jgi:hypothetical protein